jgi:hypothetical protein
LTLPLTSAAFGGDAEDLLPVLLELGLLLGDDDHAVLVLELLDEDRDFVADFDGRDVLELGGGDDAFALVADVDEDFAGADLDDDPFDDLAWGKAEVAVPQGLFHGEHADLTLPIFSLRGDFGGGKPGEDSIA